MKQKGFTVIELLAAVVILAIAGTVFYVQKENLKIAERDNDRKTAINAMYYSLEEVYHAKFSAYPRIINSTNLTSLDPALLKDPGGVAIGEQNSQYRYEPTGCDGDQCKGYTLRADLEREDDFIKTSRKN